MIYLPKAECLHRRLYRLHSRNLRYGVYNQEKGGFIGLRTKFDSTFLFQEYHWDNGPPYGTVKPLEDLLVTLPDHILLRERLPGYLCIHCSRPLKDEHNDKYRHEHLDGIPCSAGELVHGQTNPNQELFAWLTNVNVGGESDQTSWK